MSSSACWCLERSRLLQGSLATSPRRFSFDLFHVCGKPLFHVTSKKTFLSVVLKKGFGFKSGCWLKTRWNGEKRFWFQSVFFGQSSLIQSGNVATKKTILGLKLKSLIRLVGWLLFKVSKKKSWLLSSDPAKLTGYLSACPILFLSSALFPLRYPATSWARKM